MARLPRWQGSSQLTEVPESPTIDNEGNTDSYVVTYDGPFLVCKNSRPPKGATLPGYPGCYVERSTVTKQKGGKGTLVVYLFKPGAPVISPINIPSDAPSEEIDWVTLEKPLETNPVFNEETGRYWLTYDDLVDIEFWKQEKRPDLRKLFQYLPEDAVSDDDAVELSDNAVVFCQKLLRGGEVWRAFYPVYRKTEVVLFHPAAGTCGMIQDPPGAAGVNYPPGYVWMKTADRAVRSSRRGRWERIQEWTGAQAWDADLYQALVV